MHKNKCSIILTIVLTLIPISPALVKAVNHQQPLIDAHTSSWQVNTNIKAPLVQINHYTFQIADQPGAKVAP
ncbi:hypothetical protein [Pseudomonas sp. NPDC090208]|uniref:hypothetical protein n=1 Tax=Pseudomonas sp. NPDC090208 TaxID=3364478 RepID=UPI003814B589